MQSTQRKSHRVQIGVKVLYVELDAKLRDRLTLFAKQRGRSIRSVVESALRKGLR